MFEIFGDKLKLENYKPICLLSTLNKIIHQIHGFQKKMKIKVAQINTVIPIFDVHEF